MVSAIEEKWEVKIDVTHLAVDRKTSRISLNKRFEVGRVKGKSAEVQGLTFEEEILWNRWWAGGLLG